jgi:hypothetical protein
MGTGMGLLLGWEGKGREGKGRDADGWMAGRKWLRE